MINCFTYEKDETLDEKQKHVTAFFFKKLIKEIIKKTKHQATESICYISDKGLVSRLYKPQSERRHTT